MANNPNNRDNLTNWQPGQSGNPAGYSAGRRLMSRLEELMDKKGVADSVLTALIGGASGEEAFLKGRKPNAALMGMLLDRVAGKVPTIVAAEEPPETRPRIIIPGSDA